MKKLLFLCCCFAAANLNAQIINQPANWPNGDWTLTGTFDVASVLADPTVDPNFSYDDDGSGSGSTDILEAASPVIDLTAAVAGGESALQVTFGYDYNLGSVFDLEYFDADAAAWTTWAPIADNSSNTGGWCAAITGSFASTELDISGFSANQLANFQYRLFYDASSVWGWGFCTSSPTIISTGGTPVPDCVTLDSPVDGATDQSLGVTLSWTAAPTGTTPDSYDVYFGTTSGSLSNIGNVTGTSTSVTNLMNSTTYYWAIVPVSAAAGGNLACLGTEFSFSTVAPIPGDDCATAVSYISVFTLFSQGGCTGTPNVINLADATDDSGNDDPSCDSFSPNIGVWYTLTATSENLKFTSGTGLPGLAMYEAGICGSLVEVGCLNNTSGTVTGLTIGNDYIIYIWDDSAPGVTVDFCLEEFAPDQSFVVSCGTPTNTTHCYTANDVSTFAYSASDSASPLQLTFNAGTMESCCDDIIIYDGMDATGAVLYQGNNGGNLTGLVVSATGPNIFMVIDSDGSVQCDGSTTYASMDWDVVCLSCTPGAGTAALGICDDVNGYSIDVDITNLGDGSIEIKNDAGVTSTTVTVLGPATVGPFAFGSTVTITLGHATNPVCDVVLPAITLNSACPPDNDDCGNAMAITSGVPIIQDISLSTNVENLTACQIGGGGPSCPSGGTGSIDFGRGVWYVHNSTGAETLTIEVSGFDSEVQVFSGACGSLTCVGGDDDGGAGTGSSFCWESTASFAPVDYYIYVDGHGSTVGNATVELTAVAILPITLSSFDAVAMDRGNMVMWSTAVEVNNQYQIIERSEDGAKGWSEVDRISSKGDTREERRYEVVDNEPFATSYYRVKSVDFDGYTDFSQVISVTRKADTKKLNVFPNPTSDMINVETALAAAGSVVITLVDVQGKLAISQTIYREKGTLTYPVDMQGLTSGLYVLTVSTDDSTFVQRVVKN